MDPDDIAALARTFGVLQCDACADAIQFALVQHGESARRIEIAMPRFGGLGMKGNIYADSGRFAGQNISTNGRHVAIEYLGRMYDNNFPDGVSRDDWLEHLVTRFGSISDAVQAGAMTLSEVAF
jgi:hypothetical protein